MGQFSALAAGTDSLAFAVGALTTYFDCYQTLTVRIGRVPETFRVNSYVLGLAVVCGAIAALACWASRLYPSSVLSTVLTLDYQDPFRGLVVGASVLILLRSKVFNIQDSSFGGDYLYQLARDSAIHDVNSKWTIVRGRFQNLNIDAALQDRQFEANATALIAANIRARPNNIQVRINETLIGVTENRPVVPFKASSPPWIVYYRALIGVALDGCGASAVRALPGFR